jgi:hypothetical protein
MLAAVYSDAAERHQVAQSQGTVDMKGVFTDIKTRLEGHFELTKDQNVSVCILAEIFTKLNSQGQHPQVRQRHDLQLYSYKLYHNER